jgi:hypothetical protein
MVVAMMMMMMMMTTTLMDRISDLYIGPGNSWYGTVTIGN